MTEPATHEQVALAWHDVICPEGRDCRNRRQHAQKQTLATSGVLERFLERLHEITGDPVVTADDQPARTPAELWFGLILLQSCERMRDELRREGKGGRALAYAEYASELRGELESAVGESGASPAGSSEAS